MSSRIFFDDIQEKGVAYSSQIRRTFRRS